METRKKPSLISREYTLVRGLGVAVTAQPKAISFRERGACSVRAKSLYFSVQTSSLGSLCRKRRERGLFQIIPLGRKWGGKENEIRATHKWRRESFSPFSIWLMQSERIPPELFKLHGQPSTNPGAQTPQSHSVNSLHTLSKFGRPF